MPADPRPPTLRELALSFGEAALFVLAGAAVGLATDAVRGSLPLVRRAPFDLYTDCPEISEDIPEVAPEKLGPRPKGVLFVDARRAWDYCRGHLPGAVFLPMYETEPPDPDTVAKLKAKRGLWIVVYGDPDVQSGRRLATALAQAGVRGIHLLAGGLEAWKKRGWPLERCAIPSRPPKELPARVLLVDARPEEVCNEDRLPGALCLPFDDVLPPDPKVLARLKAAGRPIVVYDQGPSEKNGLRPAWAVAAELKARGIVDVQVLEDGPEDRRRHRRP